MDEVNKGIPETDQIKKRILNEALAAANLGFATPVFEEMLRWYKQVAVHTSDITVSLDADMSRIAWRTEGIWDNFAGPMVDYLQGFPLRETAARLFNDTVSRLGPERIGSFISACKDVFELGWFIPDPLAIDKLFGTASFSGIDNLKQWAEKYGVKQMLDFGASLDADNLIMECVLPIVPNKPGDALETGLLLFRYLGLPYPPDRLLAVINGCRDKEVAAALWFTEKNLYKAGLIIKDPAIETVVGCASELGLDLDKLAVFEAAMDAKGPAQLEIALTGAEQFQLILHYQKPVIDFGAGLAE